MAKIVILLSDLTEYTVNGAVIGEFGVHKAFDTKGAGYTITFIPFKTAAASTYKSREDALRIAWMLHSINAGVFIRALYIIPVKARVILAQQQVFNLIVNSGERV